MTGRQVMSQIDRSSVVPFYDQLRSILLDRVGHEWHAGDQLPSESALCAQYEVSRTVVRQALDSLTSEGLVHKVKGKGAFIAQNRLDATFVQNAVGFYEEMTRRGHTVTSRILRHQIGTADVQAAAKLEVPIGSAVVHFDRVRSVDGEPIQVVCTALPQRLVPGFDAIDMTDRSLYSVLREQYSMSPVSGQRTIWAAGADATSAGQLRLTEGQPVLMVQSLSRDEHGRAFEWFIATYRGDRSQFAIGITRGGH